MAKLQDAGADAGYLINSQTAETEAYDLGTSLQTLLTHLILLLSFGLFSRGQWSPALIVLGVYLVTLVGLAQEN